MNAEEQQREVEDLELRIERLRALYDQYFMGIEKIEPGVQRKDVERRIWLLRKEQIRNTGVRFKFQTVIQRYNTFQQYWARTVREIENGTYKRDVLRAAKRFGAKDALTILGKKKAAQYAALAEAQEADLAKRRKQPNAIDDAEIEALEDYDADLEEFDDDAPTPASRRMDLPPGAADDAYSSRSAAAAAYTARMELDFGPTPGVESEYDQLDADTGRISVVPATQPSRPSPVATESSPTPGSPRAQPLRGWPLVPPAAGSAANRLASPQLPRPSRPDLGSAAQDPDVARRRLAELAAQGRRPQGGPPSEANPARLDLELGPGAGRPQAPLPLGAPTPFSARGPLPQPAPSRPGQPQPATPRPGAQVPPPGSVPSPLSPRVPPGSPLSQPRPPISTPDPSAPAPRPLVTQVQRPVQAFAGLANRGLSASRPLVPNDAPPPAPPPASGSDPAAQARAAAAAAARDAATAAREAAASRTAARDDAAIDEQRMRQVYTKYMDAKRQTNESTAGVTYERLAQSLKAQEAKLRASHAGKRVDFEVVVKDGKATLKPIVR